MPLRVPQVPVPARTSVLAALGSPSAFHDVRTPALRTAGDAARPTTALPLHVMDTPAPSDPSGEASYAPAGWRFLVHVQDAAVAAADTRPTPDGWAFSHFSEGPYVAAVATALTHAERLSATLQPRLLSIPRLYMLTLWLHSDHTAPGDEGTPLPGDVFIPLAPAPPGIAAYRPYETGELIGRIRRRLAPSRQLLPAPLAAPTV